ncbi:MAG: carbohydrate kinase [Fuerstiella sp.]
MNQKDGPGPVIVGLGEILWDVFPDGPRFGGAPANFACSAAGLTDKASVRMVSAVGDDELGRLACGEFARRGVGTSAVKVSELPTGTVDVSLDDAGKAKYRFAENVAWDDLTWSKHLEELARLTDAVCFGTLGQRSDVSRQTIQRFVSDTPTAAIRVFDINLRPPFYTNDIIKDSLQICNCLKLNDEELPLVAELSNAEEATGQGQLQRIAECWDLRSVVVTRGANGAALWHRGDYCEVPGVPTDVKDTVGAGDSFTAALTIGLLQQMDPQQVCTWACRVAAFVCSRSGATPAIPSELRLV